MNNRILDKIGISKAMQQKVPNIVLGAIECKVRVEAHDVVLWKEIEHTCQQLQKSISIPDIKNILAIDAARKAYKACGKDPARYRLSAEALMRRVLKGNHLYQLNNVVDFVNLISLKSGFSIGGYDADKIEGDIVFDIGQIDELYDGIGRGKLNIDGLPVFRDTKGAFGSPTSDSVRTCVTNTTKHFLMILIGFNGIDETIEAITLASNMLKQFNWASEIHVHLIQ